MVPLFSASASAVPLLINSVHCRTMCTFAAFHHTKIDTSQRQRNGFQVDKYGLMVLPLLLSLLLFKKGASVIEIITSLEKEATL